MLTIYSSGSHNNPPLGILLGGAAAGFQRIFSTVSGGSSVRTLSPLGRANKRAYRCYKNCYRCLCSLPGETGSFTVDVFLLRRKTTADTSQPIRR